MMAVRPDLHIGEQIRRVRQTFGLSVREFASVIDVDKSTVHAWERGDSTPRLQRLEDIARELGLELRIEFYAARLPVIVPEPARLPRSRRGR